MYRKQSVNVSAYYVAYQENIEIELRVFVIIITVMFNIKPFL